MVSAQPYYIANCIQAMPSHTHQCITPVSKTANAMAFPLIERITRRCQHLYMAVDRTHKDSCPQCPQRNRRRLYILIDETLIASRVVFLFIMWCSPEFGRLLAFMPSTSDRSELRNPETAPTRTLVLGKYLLGAPPYTFTQQRTSVAS